MNTCLQRIEIRDEAIPHCDPENHIDFVYVYVNYEVAPSKFVDVTGLSGTIGYDAHKKQLWARCATVDAAIATLSLATQIGEGHVALSFAQSNDLLNHYLTSAGDEYAMLQMNDLLCYNIRHQRGDPIPEGRWTFANGAM